MLLASLAIQPAAWGQSLLLQADAPRPTTRDTAYSAATTAPGQAVGLQKSAASEVLVDTLYNSIFLRACSSGAFIER